MLLIECPWCGARPADPNTLSDAAWADYVVIRQNRRGAHDERWWHVRGCGSWLMIRRDTTTHAIESVTLIGKAAQ
jgi:sarcosine oxidase, subunit delta